MTEEKSSCGTQIPGHCTYCDGPLEVSASDSGLDWGPCAACGESPCPPTLANDTPPLPPNWKELRQLALYRAGNKCEEHGCNVRDNLEVHHDQARRHGGSHDLDNLVVLCRRHHGIRTCGENEGDRYEQSMNTDSRPDLDYWTKFLRDI